MIAPYRIVLSVLLATAGIQAKWRPEPFFLAVPEQDGTRYTIKGPDWAADFGRSNVALRNPGAAVQIHFAGAREGVLPEGRKRLSGKTNFLIGDDSEAWRTGVPVYAEVVYRDLYPGIDLTYGSSQGHLKSEFYVAPGTDPAVIRMRYTGVERTHVDAHGALMLIAPGGVFRENAPELYQEISGAKVRVDGSFRIFPDGTVGFQIGDYDRSRALVIDPVIVSSTYLGGSGLDAASSVAVDNAGNVYVAGWTDSIDLPLRNAARQRSGGVEVFVAKWSGSGSTLEYCTYLGGTADDRAFGIAVDSSGNAYITGWTTSANFPTRDALQSSLSGYKDAFVVKLNSTGELAYSTYLGGSGSDSGNAIALDSAGHPTVVGDTDSSNFPVLNAFQITRRGQTDAFVTRLGSSGRMLMYSTYFGGTGSDHGTAVAVDKSGDAYITGKTNSLDLPVVNAFQPVPAGSQDAFVTKLSNAGNSIVYCTYLGGSGTMGSVETGSGIAVDGLGNAYVTGTTTSSDFPAVNAFQQNFSGGSDAFASKLNADGSGLIYSTYLGGSSVDFGLAITLDEQGSAWIAGYTAAADFAITNGAQTALAGAYDAFVARLNADGSTMLESTYLGGSGIDAANGIARQASGAIYIVGQTQSPDFPLSGATQVAAAGAIDGFLVRMTGSVTVSPLVSYKIVSRLSAKALDVRGGHDATYNGALIQQWDYAGSANQQWQLIPVDGTYYKIVSKLTGKVLDIQGGYGATYNGALIQQWDYAGSANQQWQLIPVDGTYYKIVSKLTAKVLDIQGGYGATYNGALIQQWDYAGSANQQWQLVGLQESGTIQTPTIGLVALRGAGLVRTLTLTVNDLNGGTDISTVFVLINSTLNAANACFFQYTRATNQLSLLDDANTTFLGPVTLGAGSLSNSQCSLDVAQSFSTTSGNTLTLNAALAFAGSFSGTQQIYVLAFDAANQDTGWQMGALAPIP